MTFEFALMTSNGVPAERDVVAAHADHEDVVRVDVVADKRVLREQAIEGSVVEGSRLDRRVQATQALVPTRRLFVHPRAGACGQNRRRLDRTRV